MRGEVFDQYTFPAAAKERFNSVEMVQPIGWRPWGPTNASRTDWDWTIACYPPETVFLPNACGKYPPPASVRLNLADLSIPRDVARRFIKWIDSQRGLGAAPEISIEAWQLNNGQLANALAVSMID